MISFFVPGEPRAKQSFRANPNGRGFQTARVKSWQAEVGWAAQQQMHALSQDLLTEDLRVSLTFHLPDRRRIDIDNLSKGVLDGLNGICWKDDHQIMDLHLHKRIALNRELCGVTVFIDCASVAAEKEENLHAPIQPLGQ